MTSLFFASIALALSGLLVALLLTRFRVQSPLLHRFAWGLVLAQGLFWFAGLPLQLPLLEAPNRMPSIAWSIPAPEGSAPLDLETLRLATQGEGAADRAATRGGVRREEGSAASVAGRVETPVSLGATLANLAFWTYAAGVGFGLILYAMAYASLCRTVRRARPAPADWGDAWRELQQAHGLKADIPLLTHDRLGPMLCRLPSGYAVVVPREAWSRLTARQRLAVLEHELAHVQRRDIWKSFAARLAALIHWFNPVAWWSVKQFEEAAEWDCDRRLSEKSRRHAVDYAKALVQFAEPSALPLGASLARGAALSPRIRRLTGGTSGGKDGWLKTGFFLVLVAAVSVLALVRIELVAQDADEEVEAFEHQERAVTRAAFEAEVATLLDRLDGSGQTLQAFREALATSPGRLVLQDRAAHAEASLRDEAIRSAFDDYVAEHFENVEGGLRLRVDQQDYRAQLLQRYQTYGQDVAALSQPMKEVADSLAAESEAEKLMARFLREDGAASIFYLEALRDTMRPGMEMIQDELGIILVDDGSGRFVVPPSGRERAEVIVHGVESMQAIADGIAEEMSFYARDLSNQGELNVVLKKAMQDPALAIFMATEFFGSIEEGEELSVDEAIDEVFGHLESVLVDRGDGLHVNPEMSGDLMPFIQEFDRARKGMAVMADPLAQLAALVDDEDELSRRLRKGLGGEVPQMLFARHAGIGEVTPSDAMMAVLGEVMETVDGTRRIREEAEEEVIEHGGYILRELREMRRRGRKFDALADQLTDPELAALYRSPLGQLIIARSVIEELERRPFDGLGHWIDEHFVESDEGRLTLRAEAGEELEEIVQESAEIEASLKSDF